MFAEWQPKYEAVGINAYPIGFAETKHADGRVSYQKPVLVGRYQKIGAPASAKHARDPKFADKGLGCFASRKNGFAVAGIDTRDESILRYVLETRGDSPFLVRTASGKFHAWYRHNGERQITNKPEWLFGGRPIDLIGNSNIVLASSLNPFTNTRYEIIRGTLDDLRNLPPMRGLPNKAYEATKKPIVPDDVHDYARIVDDDTCDLHVNDGSRIGHQGAIDGTRGDALFVGCLDYWNEHPLRTDDDIIAFAWKLSDTFVPNMRHEPGRVRAKAMEARAISLQGLNRRGGYSAIMMPVRQLEVLDDIYAEALLMRLRLEHGAHSDFEIPNDLHKDLGLRRRDFMQARRRLQETKCVIMIRPPSSYWGAARYRWPDVTRDNVVWFNWKGGQNDAA